MDGAPRRRIFTAYLRALERDSEAAAADLVPEVLDGLRAALASELRRRGLWNGPPSFLGVLGHEAWTTAGARARRGVSGRHREIDALEELATDCFGAVFIDRRRSLSAHLESKPNVDGLVFLAVRQFVHDRQKEADPLGYRVFQLVRSAVRESILAGDLFVVAGDERVRNETILAFDPTIPVPEGPADLERERLEALAERWCSELLPDLITARGPGRRRVVEALRRLLADLESVEWFRFHDVVDPLKSDVRARWAALFEPTEGEAVPAQASGEAVPLARRLPGLVELEERDLFEKLADCVSAGVEDHPGTRRTRDHLTTLWGFLHLHALGQASRELPASARKLAELLDIPRARIPELQAILGELVERCRHRVARPPSAVAPPMREGDG